MAEALGEDRPGVITSQANGGARLSVKVSGLTVFQSDEELPKIQEVIDAWRRP